MISSSNSPCCSCFPCRDIKQKRNSAPANAVTQDLPLPHWDILLVVAIFRMLINSGHSPVKNNYKHLIQDNSPSVFKHYSCAHIRRLIMFLEKTNVLAERRSTNCFGFRSQLYITVNSAFKAAQWNHSCSKVIFSLHREREKKNSPSVSAELSYKPL